jgi:hypothetical protein
MYRHHHHYVALTVNGAIQWWTDDREAAISTAKEAARRGQATSVVAWDLRTIAEFPARKRWRAA